MEERLELTQLPVHLQARVISAVRQLEDEEASRRQAGAAIAGARASRCRGGGWLGVPAVA